MQCSQGDLLIIVGFFSGGRIYRIKTVSMEELLFVPKQARCHVFLVFKKIFGFIFQMLMVALGVVFFCKC